MGVLTLSIYHFYPTSQPDNNGGYSMQLHNREAFGAFQSAPMLNAYSEVQSMKIVFDIGSQTVYYMNAHTYVMHFDFCRDVLGHKLGIHAFNMANYTESSFRQYILATVNYYAHIDAYALEFLSEDLLSAEQILQVHASVVSSSYLQQLKVLVNNSHLTNLKAQLTDIPLLYPTDVYQNLKYQALYAGTSVGYLRFIEDNSALKHLEPNSIVVVKNTPTYMPHCKGIITQQLQTPLSHINVLALNKHIVAITATDIWQSDYLKLDGQLVELSAWNDSFQLSRANESQLEAFAKTQTTAKPALQADVDFSSVQPLTEFGLMDKDKIGNKAARFAELLRLSSTKDYLFVPENSFAIPFHYYHQHLADTILHGAIQHLNKNSAFLSSKEIDTQLQFIRKRIKSLPVNEKLVERVRDILRQDSTYTRFRFRSSSNAEDAVGFSGAGLYKSKTAVLGHPKKTIDAAIKEVWASNWSFKAFMEREAFCLNHLQAYMGILVHRSFPNETANGVIVSTNLYNENLPGFTVNVQVNGRSVVQPDSRVTCDQMILFELPNSFLSKSRIGTEYITIGDQNEGNYVLTENQLTDLYHGTRAVQEHFSDDYELDNAWDIEFKFEKGKLYLKQVRPFLVDY